MRPDLVEDRATLAGLQREIELLERLNHPIVVRSFGGQVDGPRPHVVLEHLEGPRLSSLKRQHGPLLLEQLVALAIEISSALHYLAAEGLVHLDVKPSNIIMGGPPRLIDLSVARTFEQCATLRSPVGTDAYMAPEQAAVPSERLGPPADVWGLGATLHEGVTGERPFRRGVRDSTRLEERFPQLTEEPPELPAHVPAALAESIMACLARDPAARPTPAELGDRLQLVLAEAAEAEAVEPEAAAALMFRQLLPEPAELPDGAAVVEDSRFGELAHDDRPYLVLNMVTTADGRVTIGGRSGPIGNEADQDLFHALRTRVDAVMVGAGTLRAEKLRPARAQARAARGARARRARAGPARGHRERPARPAAGPAAAARAGAGGAGRRRSPTASSPARRRSSTCASTAAPSTYRGCSRSCAGAACARCCARAGRR